MLKRVPLKLIERLEKDIHGRGVLAMAKCGFQANPPPLVKARLQKEFGLYPRGDSDPFGDAVWESDGWCVQINMVRGDDEHPWRGGVGMSAWMRNPYLADMMAKRSKPKFSGFDAD